MQICPAACRDQREIPHLPVRDGQLFAMESAFRSRDALGGQNHPTRSHRIVDAERDATGGQGDAEGAEDLEEDRRAGRRELDDVADDEFPIVGERQIPQNHAARAEQENPEQKRSPPRFVEIVSFRVVHEGL